MQQQLQDQQIENELSLIENGLKSRGFGAEYLKAFRKTFKESGIVAARAFANGMVANGPQDPPKTWTGETSYNDVDPEEVTAYASKGPEALEKARNFYRSWQRTGSTVPLKEYLEINFDPYGSMDRARQGRQRSA